jgi:cell division protein ZapE
VIEKYRQMVAAGDVIQDPAQELAVEMLETLCHRLDGYKPGRRKWLFGKSEPEPKGLYLFGDVGRGKSMLMDLFHAAAPVDKKRRVHFHAFMQEVHGAIFEWRGLDTKARAKRPNYVREAGDDPIPPVAKAVANEATLLCFDEFQVNDVADAMILGRLFEALFGLGVVFVATSNRDPYSLYEGGINRQLFVPFIHLIADKLDLHHLDGAMDYRLERIKGMHVYHTPLGAVADAALDDAFRTLTDRKTGNSEKLEIGSRQLTVPEAAAGVARFSFADLCEVPLGAADYLAIAERYHTVLLSGIPRMGKDKRNEAKRFVTLIDALYEAKVRLIATAEVEADRLYPAGDGAFEFARTVSRLHEMQSQDYLEAR